MLSHGGRYCSSAVYSLANPNLKKSHLFVSLLDKYVCKMVRYMRTLNCVERKE